MEISFGESVSATAWSAASLIWLQEPHRAPVSKKPARSRLALYARTYRIEARQPPGVLFLLKNFKDLAAISVL
jgi:hypothetical protein